MTPFGCFVFVVLTRSVRRVFNSANVPRLGVPPSLLLDFAALNTQRTPLVAAEVCLSFRMAVGFGHQGMRAVDMLKDVK
jgi:hypothetical protein